MRIDWYTKGVLTVIAMLLGVIACKQYVSPDAVAQAEGPFAGVQFSTYGAGNEAFFDSRTGDVWFHERGQVIHERVTELGTPSVAVK